MNRKSLMFALLFSYLITTSLSPTLRFTPQSQGQTPISQTYGVHNLNTSTSYTTIKEAINDTTTLNGHTILAEAGTYHENLVINKAISLVGENRNSTIIQGLGVGTVIEVTANKVSVSNLTIKNSGNSIEDAGIKLSKVKSCSISDNILDGDRNGLMLSHSSNNSVTENLVVNSSDSGIAVYNSNNNTVERNSVKNSRGYGVFLQNSSHSRVIANVIVGSIDDGIAVLNSQMNLVQNNTAMDGQAHGIRLDDPSNNNLITENTVTNNTEYGFWMWYSNNNSFTHNFCNNRKNVLILTIPSYNSINQWDDGYPSAGNYWSDYEGVDVHSGPYQNKTGSDGIGDTPYNIDENNTDNYPLMGKFSSFPATPAHQVTVVSNSTIEDFEYYPANSTIKILVLNTSANLSSGFCQIRIPRALMSPPYVVTIDDGLIEVLHFNGTLYDDGVNGWIYFAYSYSAREVVVTPKFPSMPLDPLTAVIALVIVTGIATGGVIYVKAFRKKRKTGP